MTKCAAQRVDTDGMQCSTFREMHRAHEGARAAAHQDPRAESQTWYDFARHGQGPADKGDSYARSVERSRANTDEQISRQVWRSFDGLIRMRADLAELRCANAWNADHAAGGVSAVRRFIASSHARPEYEYEVQPN